MERSRYRPYVPALTAIFFWATIPTAFKAGLADTSPPLFLFWANATSLGIFAVIILAGDKSRQILRQSKQEWFRSAMLGVLSPFAYYLILFEAYSRLPGQVAQPLNMIWPLVLVYLSALLLRQKIPPRSYLALLISFAGIFFVSSQGRPFDFRDTDLPAVFLAAGSSVIWALFWVLQMKDKREEVIRLFTNFLFAFLYISLFMLFRHESLLPSPKALLASLYCGFFEMGITFLLWLKALQTARNTATISNLVYLAPFLSLFFLHFFIGEKIHLTTLAGLFLIIGGIFVQNYRPLTPDRVGPDKNER